MRYIATYTRENHLAGNELETLTVLELTNGMVLAKTTIPSLNVSHHCEMTLFDLIRHVDNGGFALKK
jgi:hypothetical protein